MKFKNLLMIGLLLASMFGRVAYANYSFKGQELLVIANISGEFPLPGAKKDLQLFESNKNAIKVADANKNKILDAVKVFAESKSSQCSKGYAKAFPIFYSGHATTNNDKYYLVGSESTAEKDDLLSFDDFIKPLENSSCNYLLVMDTEPSIVSVDIPKNVAILWANKPGMQATDIGGKGGLLTRSVFNEMHSLSCVGWLVKEIVKNAKQNVELKTSDAINFDEYFSPWLQTKTASHYQKCTR